MNNVNWGLIREEEFPALDKNNLIYLVSAGASLMSKSAYESSLNYFQHMREKGDIDHELLFMKLEETRKMVAKSLNCNHDEIAFMINTSSGICTTAHLFLDQKGDLMYPSIEFPTSIHIFKRLGYKCKEIKAIKGSYPIESISKQITENTKYSIQSHVQSFNGFRQDLFELGKLCKKNRIINIINATQSFGAFKINVDRDQIDVLTTNALKWLGCGYGIGILFVKEEIIRQYRMPFTGWLSVENPFNMDNKNVSVIEKTKMMDSLGGCPNFGSLLALEGAFKMLKIKIGNGSIVDGIKRIQKRILTLTGYFVEKLTNLNVKIISPLDLRYRSGIVTIEHSKAKKIHRLLSKNNIVTTLKRYPNIDRDTLIRFAINYYNNFDDLDEVIKILNQKNLLKSFYE